MKALPRVITPLAVLVAALAGAAAVAGLAWQDDGPGGATSVRGETVELQGEGLYQNDTTFIAEGSRGTDVVTLAFGIPLLVGSLVLVRRGSSTATVATSTIRRSRFGCRKDGS